MTPVQAARPPVAIQGEAGSFSHMAALKLWAEGVQLVPTTSFRDLFQAVETGGARFGVVPVENTLAGSVQGNLELILKHRFHVVAETRVRIELSLVAPAGRTMNGIRTAASHPVALQQCQTFFASHPAVEPVAVYDTAGSIRDLMAGKAAYDAAIGSALAARIYGGEVVKQEIEDNQENYTRFFAVSTEPSEPQPKQAKASLAFVVEHRPGSLHQALGTFARRSLDLTKLESRPIPGRPWEYRFFVDIRDVPSETLEACLEELSHLTSELQVLGTYLESEG